jgi:hypothetical protein
VALHGAIPRLFVVLLLCAVAGEGATAQFRRGILAESTEIKLFPAVPPSLHAARRDATRSTSRINRPGRPGC